jgi:sulfate adenylyltransferase
MIEPHGGRLVDKTVSRTKYADWIEDIAGERPAISLDNRHFQDALNIANGRYSPLTGYMNQEDFLRVVDGMRLDDGTIWSLPILLDVGSSKAAALQPGERVPLEGPDGHVAGLIDIEEVYKYNKKQAARKLFSTGDEDHPGVADFIDQGDFLVGGDIRVFEEFRYNDHDLKPAESRVLFRQYGWDSVVGFQTRNAPHRGHEYIQKAALEQVDGLLIQPKIGKKKPGDYQSDVILGTYEELIENYYPEYRVVLSVFPSRMQYAGPREAVLDAIVRKNQGCTHFIIGRDHAGVGDYYDGTSSHRIFGELEDIGIEPLRFQYAFYCETCDGMCSDKICPHGDEERIYPSGSRIRKLLRNGEIPSEKMIRPEIATFISESEEPFIH